MQSKAELVLRGRHPMQCAARQCLVSLYIQIQNQSRTPKSLPAAAGTQDDARQDVSRPGQTPPCRMHGPHVSDM